VHPGWLLRRLFELSLSVLLLPGIHPTGQFPELPPPVSFQHFVLILVRAGDDCKQLARPGDRYRSMHSRHGIEKAAQFSAQIERSYGYHAKPP
jgi:hypothetical protein